MNVTLNDYCESILKNHALPCYIVDFESHELLEMNDSMEQLLGGREEFQGKRFYHVLKNENKYDSGDYEHIVPVFNWENEPIHRNRIYDSRLDQSFDATVFPIGFGNEKYLFIEVIPLVMNDEISNNLDQVMAESLKVIQKGEEVIPSFLKLLSTFYSSERAFIYRIDEEKEQIILSHKWHSVTGLESTDDVSMKFPVLPVLNWLSKRNEVGILEANIRHTSLTEDSFDMKILQTFNLKNLLLSAIEDSNGRLIAAIGVGDRENQKLDFCYLQAVTEFIKQEITKEVITNIEKMYDIDILTGFYRRSLYNKRLRALLEKPPKSLGVLFTNVNGLKVINSEFGYAKGDNYIKKAAEILKENFETDFYRISGDEFVAFFPDCDKKALKNAVIELQEHIAKKENYIFAVGHSYAEGRYQVEDVIEEADNRMFINKQEYYHSANVSVDNVSDSTLGDLLTYLKNGEFMIYLQPQVKLADGSLYGAEALIRRFDKVNEKMVFPDQFISLYEKKSVIRHIDIFVVEEVCKLLSRWQEEGKALIPVSVNLSRVTLQEYRIVEVVASICDDYQIPHEYLVIEVTERVGLIENNVASSLIQDFQAHGFRISLDDFGCAYSNIVTLAQLDVDEVKIDKSLVDFLTVNPKNRVLVDSVIKMCDSLGNISNLAEGIEEEEQANVLKDLHCHLAQGYFYSRPLPVSDFCLKYER